jgi:2-C-methyl-D-erythritol 4-phosphate cytidylyltransferase
VSVVALVPAAGRGERLGMDVAKAFVPVAGHPLLWHAVRGVLDSGCVDAVVVAAPPSDVDRAVATLAPLGDAVSVIAGGRTRVESVRLTLDRALAAWPDIEVVLVHDAARAFTPPAVFAAVVAAVRSGRGAVIPVLPLVDTVKRVDGDGRIVSTVDRSTLRSVQTPQGFTPPVLRRAHAQPARHGVTDDAGLVEALGEPVYAVPGDPAGFKITTALDLALAESVLAR